MYGFHYIYLLHSTFKCSQWNYHTTNEHSCHKSNLCLTRHYWENWYRWLKNYIKYQSSCTINMKCTW